MSTARRMRTLSRRAFLGGSAAIAAGGLEFWSLAGRFDHCTLPPEQRLLQAGDALRSLASHGLNAAALHVGHSTHLLQVGGLRVLTDPWFYDPSHGGMRHSAGPAFAPSALGDLAAIVVTHEHPDHEDPKAIDRMDKRAHMFVATAEQRVRMRRLGFTQVTVLAPWETARVGVLTLHAVPALHDVYEIGFVLQAGADSVYFAGDTALHPAIDDIRERFAPTAAILPVDGTGYRAGQQWVLGPEQAAMVAARLGVGCVMPTHHEAHITDPVLALLLEQAGNSLARFGRRIRTSAPTIRLMSPRPGEVVSLRVA